MAMEADAIMQRRVTTPIASVEVRANSDERPNTAPQARPMLHMAKLS